MTEAKAGYGTELRWNGFTIAEVTNIAGPNITFDQIDATHYQSPNHYKEFIAGFGDGGTITLDCTLVPTDTDGQRRFLEDAGDKEVRETLLRLGSPVIAEWMFEGAITRLEFAQPMDGRISFSSDIKVSGVPELRMDDSDGLTALVIETDTLGVITLVPVFAATTYTYECTVDSADDTFDLTVTSADDSLRYRVDGGDWTDLESTVQVTDIALGAQGTITRLDIDCYGGISKMYTVYITRPVEAS